MCGIVAVFGNDSYSIAEKALNKIKHRGKDATKLLQLSFGTIGFDRLSINDKSENAMQPFEFSNLVGVFNAEIYNAEELKAKFEIQTLSNADTEIILPLFEKIGSSIIHQLDGFYSGVIFNKQTNQIFTLRDYIGKKPLFFGKSEQFEFLTSELKAIENITEFEIIPKGFCEISNKKVEKIEEHKIGIVSKGKLKETIIDAVKKRIPNEEEKFGVFLSGGLDSSIVAAIVTKFSDKAIFYTLGNSETLDLKFVAELSKSLNIENRLKIISLPVESQIPDLIEKVVYYTESYNPSIVSNGLATYLLSGAAYKDGIKVVLSGEGADELFCGYPISKSPDDWFEKRVELIENMHFTELRRLDLASMANTIEIRCPFLDRNVFAASNECSQADLIETINNNLQGKKILRELFFDDLPKAIAERNKVSFDVGSGIRKLVIEHLTKRNNNEKESLKTIWLKHFPSNLSDNNYFHSYPTFDKAIAKRGVTHKTTLEFVEALLLKEFETVPFHNLFMLNNISKIASPSGGTCSDKVLHFKKILADNGIISKLHSAFISAVECHRMLSVEIDNQKYFIDVGSGWASTKLFPAFAPFEYSVYGMTFKTEVFAENIVLFHKTENEFKPMVTIPLQTKSEEIILEEINNRFADTSIYPFQNSLRFSKVKDNSFYFIKGNTLRIYNQNKQTEIKLSEEEILNMIQDNFNFDLTNMKFNFT